MVTITTHKCDVCKTREANYLKEKLQVVFTTEQTEGRPTKPHLSLEIVDLCEACMEQIIEKHPVKAHGAQGYNTYVVSP